MMVAKKTKSQNQTINKKVTTAFPTKLTWLPKKTFELEIIIPKDKVSEEYQVILKKTAANTVIKGFRKGKAPLDLVEKQIDKAKLYEEVANQLIPDSYDFAVDHHKLRPIVTPKIDLVNAKLGQDWVIKATACEPPDVKLGDYKDKIKGLKAKSTIWTPDKGKPDQKDKTKEPDLNQVFEQLLQTSEVEVADILVERETNRLLSQLLDQVNSLGMTIQQYATSKGKTEQQLRQDYELSSRDGLKLEFILSQIALDNNITVSDDEINALINKSNDPNLKPLASNPSQKAYLAILLRKQKTIDFLKSL